MAMRVVAFDTRTGDRIARVPGSFTWETESNEYGSIKVTSGWTKSARELKTWQRTQAKRTILAVLDGAEVVCAGPVQDRDPQTSGFTLNAAASIWWTLEDRLVLNPVLQSTFVDGEVLIDEDNPAPEWFTSFTGSYADIGADLVDLALAWGDLPIVTPAREGGTRVRTYNGWELLTVASRLKLLTGVIDGVEIRFRPELRPDGGIQFVYEAAPELISKTHRWNCTLPGQRVSMVRFPEDASGLASDVWAFGGKSDDIVLAARSTTSALTDLGWPVMQRAVTGLSSVSELSTLKGHTDERALRGSVTPVVYELRVHRSHAPKAGDWANVTFRHPAYEGLVDVPLKVLYVGGDSGEWLTVKGRQRNGL